jgi:hypothetical protein
VNRSAIVVEEVDHSFSPILRGLDLRFIRNPRFDTAGASEQEMALLAALPSLAFHVVPLPIR